MAKKREQVDYTQLPDDELRRRLSESREKLFSARFRNASGALKNPLSIRFLRREVARLSTFLNQRGKK